MLRFVHLVGWMVSLPLAGSAVAQQELLISGEAYGPPAYHVAEATSPMMVCAAAEDSAVALARAKVARHFEIISSRNERQQATRETRHGSRFPDETTEFDETTRTVVTAPAWRAAALEPVVVERSGERCRVRVRIAVDKVSLLARPLRRRLADRIVARSVEASEAWFLQRLARPVSAQEDPAAPFAILPNEMPSPTWFDARSNVPPLGRRLLISDQNNEYGIRLIAKNGWSHRAKVAVEPKTWTHGPGIENEVRRYIVQQVIGAGGEMLREQLTGDGGAGIRTLTIVAPTRERGREWIAELDLVTDGCSICELLEGGPEQSATFFCAYLAPAEDLRLDAQGMWTHGGTRLVLDP